jgi:hypothetical protein
MDPKPRPPRMYDEGLKASPLPHESHYTGATEETCESGTRQTGLATTRPPIRLLRTIAAGLSPAQGRVDEDGPVAWAVV